MLTISQLYIYPVKSLGGITLNSAEVTDRGFKHDRRWMLVNENNQFLTQRVFPEMALLKVSLVDNGLLIHHRKKGYEALVPFEAAGDEYDVEVWDDICKAVEVSTQASEWFSDALSMKCKLVFMPDETHRPVDTAYAFNKEITSFSDAYPFTVIGQSSLDDLNRRLNAQLSINRFRPNIVFKGGVPFEEDNLAHFMINQIHFYGVKPCARCVVTTIDQEEAVKGKEPLQILSSFRQWNNKIYFGQNVLHKGEGVISIGDSLQVIERKRGTLSGLLS
jgi:uncharacterized protein